MFAPKRFLNRSSSSFTYNNPIGLESIGISKVDLRLHPPCFDSDSLRLVIRTSMRGLRLGILNLAEDEEQLFAILTTILFCCLGLLINTSNFHSIQNDKMPPPFTMYIVTSKHHPSPPQVDLIATIPSGIMRITALYVFTNTTKHCVCTPHRRSVTPHCEVAL